MTEAFRDLWKCFFEAHQLINYTLVDKLRNIDAYTTSSRTDSLPRSFVRKSKTKVEILGFLNVIEAHQTVNHTLEDSKTSTHTPVRAEQILSQDSSWEVEEHSRDIRFLERVIEAHQTVNHTLKRLWNVDAYTSPSRTDSQPRLFVRKSKTIIEILDFLNVSSKLIKLSIIRWKDFEISTHTPAQPTANKTRLVHLTLS